MRNADFGGASLFSALLSTAAVAVAFGAPTAAMANDVDDDQERITIIGQRDAEIDSPKSTAPLIDTPLTISVIPAEVFEQQGARNLTDVLNNTPGITFNAGENGFGTGVSNFSMRGFDTSANVFIDGARDSGSFSRDAFNIEQVEVVKGPAGDNGRGGAGGYVNLVTKSPHEAASYEVSTSFGFDEYDSDERWRTTIDLNQPLSNTAAARLNVLLEDGGVAGRAVASRSTFGFAPSIVFGLGTDTQLLFALQHTRQEDTPDWGIPAVFIDGMREHDLFYTLPPGLDPESFRDVYYGFASDYDNVDASVARLRLDHRFSRGLDFSSQLRWSRTDRESIFGFVTQINNPAVNPILGGGPPVAPTLANIVRTQRFGYARENESLSWLNNFSSRFTTGGWRHRVAFGVEYSQEEATARNFNTSAVVDSPIGVAPNPNRAVGTPTATGRSDVEVSTIAAYFYDTIELSPQWQLTGGLRVESYEVDISTSGTASPGANNLSISETTLAGRLGVVYKPAENASIYASVGVAPQPPASFLSTSDISREGDNGFPGYSTGLNSSGADVQQSVNYELGVKWEFNDRLFATAALFRTERQNVAISGRVPTDASGNPALGLAPLALVGYGEQVVQGLELGLSGQITPQWSVFAGALFMESEREHSAQLDLYRCYANPADYYGTGGAVGHCFNPGGAGLTPVSAVGDALAFTPEVSANLWTTYEFPFGLTVGGGVRYVDDSFVGRPDDAERIIPNRGDNKLPSYWVANAVVSYEFTPDTSLRLNVDNITDEFYAMSTNWSTRRVILGTSRSFLLTLNHRF